MAAATPGSTSSSAKADGTWHFPDGFADEHQAWEAIRLQLTEAFRLAAADDFDSIAALPQLQTGSMTVAKAIYVYNPARMLPVFAKSHRDYWMALLGGSEDSGAYAWDGSHRLLQVVRQQHPELGDWLPQEIMRFLYDWAHPNEAPTIVKIAPGYNADLWPDCLNPNPPMTWPAEAAGTRDQVPVVLGRWR